MSLHTANVHLVGISVLVVRLFFVQIVHGVYRTFYLLEFLVYRYLGEELRPQQ